MLKRISAWFACANRTVPGLGIATAGDIPGLSPRDRSDPDHWSYRKLCCVAATEMTNIDQMTVEQV